MQLTNKSQKIKAFLAAPVVGGQPSYVCAYQDITSKGTVSYTKTGSMSAVGYVDIIPGPPDSNTIRNIVSIDFSNESASAANITVSFVDKNGSAYPIGIQNIQAGDNWNVFIEPNRLDRSGTVIISNKNHKLQSYLASPVTSSPVYYVAVYQDSNVRETKTYTIAGSISGTTPVDTITGPISSNTTRKILSLDFCNADSSNAAVTVTFVTEETNTLGVKEIGVGDIWNVFSITSSGTVSSVSLTAPSAFTVTGSPVTTSGTIALAGSGTTSQLIDGTGALQTIPTTLPPTGNAGGDLSGTYPDPTVSRVHGIDVQSGTPSTDDVLIYGGSPNKWQHQKLHSNQVTNDSTVTGTDVDDALNTLDSGKVNTTRSISTTSPLSGGGDLSADRTLSIQQANGSQSGYLSSADWNTFNSKGNGTVTSVAALTLGTSGTDLSSTVATGTTTPAITLNVPTASASNRGALSSADWSTFNGKQNALTLTTTGTSGAATLVGSTLNIPQYSGGGGGTDSINWTHTEALPNIGSAIKAEPLYTHMGSLPNTAATPTIQRLYLIAVWLGKAATITGVKWLQSTIGVYTASNYNGVGLYTLSGGTFTRVAQSTNDGTLLSTGSGNTLKAKAFSSTYSASAGLYYAALLYSASVVTTNPTLVIMTNPFTNSFTLDNTNGVYFSMFSNSQTTMPTTIAPAGLFLQSQVPYLALY